VLVLILDFWRLTLELEVAWHLKNAVHIHVGKRFCCATQVQSFALQIGAWVNIIESGVDKRVVKSSVR